jgi:hypothetical protein
VITFIPKIPTRDSLIFDKCYEPELQLDLDEKSKLLNSAIAAFMLIDGVLAGETFGVQLKDLDEEIEDCTNEPPQSVYCYSTTILPAFQHKGLAKILKAFWLGQCFELRLPIVGHSTSPEMKHINALFGAVHSIRHENWYKTARTAWFYHLQNK